jgi:hypothetical protein
MAGRKRQLTYFEEQLLFELRAIRLAIVDHSTNTGKWLAAVAKAAANPADNSAEVQRALDEIAAEIEASTAQQQEAIDEVKENDHGSRPNSDQSRSSK